MNTGPDDPTARRARAWMTEVCAELGVDPTLVATLTDPMLDLIREVAHRVARPSAPLTAFVLGLAAGAAIDPGQATPAATQALQARVDQVLALALRFPTAD
jgi:hypothetical protein